MTRISVAMCTYNGGGFLPEQLTSIAMQNRLPDELVVCDDGSSDDSLELLQRFADQVSFPVRIIRNAENLGSSRNFEKGISLSRGDILVLADQDDIWYPHKLELLERCFTTKPAACVAAFSDADMVDRVSRPLHQTLWNAVGFTAGERQRFAAGYGWNVLIKHPVVTGATLAFRRDQCSYLLPIHEGIAHDRWISFLLSVRGEIALVADPLIQYRTHRQQQIGVEAQGVRKRVQQARRRGDDFYRLEIEFLRRVCDRMEECRRLLPSAADAIGEARRKISHLENRVRSRRRNGMRVPDVLREVFNRGYWKYSAGWESVAKDLFRLGAL